MSILRHSDIDLNKINYEKPEKQGVVYYSPINYSMMPLYLQTPKMICKKDSSLISGSRDSNLDMECISDDFSFYDFMLSLDEMNVSQTYKNNEAWFGKQIPLEIIDNMYKSACKPVKKDGKPMFSFKVPMIKDKVQCQIYDQMKTCIDFSRLTEGTEIVCILHVKGLKFLKQHYYCDLYISQVKVFLPGQTKYSILDSYAFNDKDEEFAELQALDQELLLDEDFRRSIQNDEKDKIMDELMKEKVLLDHNRVRVEELEAQLREF